MRDTAHTVVCSALPDPAEGGAREVDEDFDLDAFVDDEDDAPEGSFFGASDDAATNRVWSMFARASVRDGHGKDLLSPDGKHARTSPRWHQAGGASA